MIKPKNKKCVECGREDQPWFSKKRCKSCAQKAYSSKQLSKQNVNKYIKPVSDKQAERLKKYRKLRDEYMTVNSVCEVRGCKRKATDLHHMKGRVGEDLTNVDYFLAVCRPCHTWIEEHPAEAKEQGYSTDRLS